LGFTTVRLFAADCTYICLPDNYTYVWTRKMKYFHNDSRQQSKFTLGNCRWLKAEQIMWQWVVLKTGEKTGYSKYLQTCQ